MGSPLNDRVGRSAASTGIDPRLAPTAAATRATCGRGTAPRRPGADPDALDDWGRRHGFLLRKGLRNWLVPSAGLSLGKGPLVHPRSAIGPMGRFARVPDLLVQPESWFELG